MSLTMRQYLPCKQHILAYIMVYRACIYGRMNV